MIRFSTLTTFCIRAKDGDVGRVKDIYFDDTSWCLRYFIVDTSRWLSSRKVLLSPEALASHETDDNHIPVNLTKEQIENSPSMEEHLPVSRQHEISLSQYYGWGHYWVPPTAASDPFPVAPGSIGASNYKIPREVREALEERRPAPDAHLHSCRDVERYSIRTLDGEICTIRDFLIEPGLWRINHLVLDTGSWFGGKDVICPPVFVDTIDWQSGTIQVGLAKSVFEEATEFNSATFSDDYERRIVKHYFDNLGQGAPSQGRGAPREEATSFV